MKEMTHYENDELTLVNLHHYHRDATFEQFCREVFPDFDAKKSCGYLLEKFDRFQYCFIGFLSDLDKAHLAYLTNAIQSHNANN